MTDLPLFHNTPYNQREEDENELALAHIGLPYMCLGANSLNILQSSRLKKAVKI